MKNIFRKLVVCLLVILGNIVISKGQANYNGFYLIDAKTHQKNIGLFKNKNVAFLETVSRLKKAGEMVLNKEVYSVTFHKTKLASSGNVHDFYSQSPYYFVDKGGKAFMKDGTRNAKIKEDKDKEQLNKLLDDLQVLSLAYFYTKDERFAERAKKLMDTWFISENTRMNPNMDFAQIKPNSNQGSFSGIIESKQLVYIPDILCLLKDSKKIDTAFILSMRQWFKSYLSWLKSSRLGNIAAVQKNNQVNYYNLQVYVFSLFTGTDIKQVRSMITKTTANINTQISKDGEQLLELKRANPIGYSIFSLKGLVLIALFSENIDGPDLWNYEKDGSSIRSALMWLGQQYINQKNHKKASPKFENILPSHLLGLYTVAQSRTRNLSLSNVGIANKSSGLRDTYFRFN